MTKTNVAIHNIVNELDEVLDVLAYNIADDDSATVSVRDWDGHVVTVKVSVISVTTDHAWLEREAE